jgi:hypothetical protein
MATKIPWLVGYERNTLLWEEGIAYQHWMHMYWLGYNEARGNACKCGSCVRAAALVDRATEENKPKTKGILHWLRGG